MENTEIQDLPAELTQCKLGETRQLYRLTTSDENRRAVAALLSQSHHHIDIFSHCLDARVFDQQEVLDAIKDTVITQRRAAIRILIRDPQPMINQGHRVTELMRRLTSYIDIRKVHPHFAETGRMYLLADDSGYLAKENDDRYEGVVCFNDPVQVRDRRQHFNEVWEHSQAITDMRRLHI